MKDSENKARISEIKVEIDKLESQLLPFTTIDPVDACGKTISRIIQGFYNSLHKEGDCCLILFTDNTALYQEGTEFEVDPEIWWSSAYRDSQTDKYICNAYLTDFGYWMKDEHLLNEEVVAKILELAIEMENLRCQERVKEEIQQKLDEISKLKDQL